MFVYITFCNHLGQKRARSKKKKNMEVRSSRRGRERESSPDRVKVYNMHQRVVKPIKKVQVVYYLSRNGHLEHPHYMEVTHLVNQPLRLRGRYSKKSFISCFCKFGVQCYQQCYLIFFLFCHVKLIDVTERLTVLRGKGMPSLYSWSCKRYIIDLFTLCSEIELSLLKN